MSLLRAWLCGVALLVLLGSPAPLFAQDGQAASSAPTDCHAFGADERVRAIVASLDKVRATDPQLWRSYRPGSVTYTFVLRSETGGWCGAIWRDGAVQTIELAAAPTFSTPMYGFHMTGGTSGWTQPVALAQQLEALGINRTVIVPIVPEIKLPFELRPPALFDMAVHEAVHLNVQAPAWTHQPGPHEWPSWEAGEPERPALAAACYVPADAAVKQERAALVGAAMTALEGGDRARVCTGARAFIDARLARWKALRDATVAGSQPMACRQAEAVMELAEGVPDFVAWISAYQSGVVSADRVRSRFMAEQRDVFYLTGAMQLVVMKALLGDDGFAQLTQSIARSGSWRDAELFGAMEATVASQCRVAPRTVADDVRR